MNNCVYISFYTINTPYEQEIKILEESLKKFNLNYKFYPIKTVGSWEKNCQKKSIILKQSLEDFPNNNIVYTDSDSIILRQPILFETLTSDFAYCILPWRENEVLSGTLFIRNKQKVKDFINKWIDLNSTNNLWDQKNLQTIIEQNKDLNYSILPHSYVYIYDNLKQKQALTEEPVIIHNQASRRFKRKMNT